MTEQTVAIIDKFSNSLKSTPEYLNYLKKRDLLQEDKERWQRANEYRRARFRLMHDNPDPYQLLESFEKDNESLHMDRNIEEYLAAECEVCRMIQEVYVKISAAIDIDIDA